MPQMIVAMYQDRGGAEGALQALLTAGVARDRIGLIGAEHQPQTELAPTRGRPQSEAAARLRALPIPASDIASFEAGLGQGGVLLTARVEDDQVDKAFEVIDLFSPVDLGSREGQRSGGVGGVEAGAPLGASLAAGQLGGVTNTAAVPGMRAMAGALDDSGSADLRTDQTSLDDMGSSARATGDRRAEDRAGAPGTMELAAGAADVLERDFTRSSGRVRVYNRGG